MARQKNVVTKTVVDLMSVGGIQDLVAALGAEADAIHDIEDALGGIIAQKLEAYYIKPMLWQLREEPPRQLGMKIKWTSVKQRKAYFASNGFGGGIPSTRSHALAMGWSYEIVSARGKVVVRVRNGKRYMRYVQGDIGLGLSVRSIERYKAPIQQFHTDRGWQPAAPIIQKGYQRSLAYAVDAVSDRLSTFHSRRRST